MNVAASHSQTRRAWQCSLLTPRLSTGSTLLYPVYSSGTLFSYLQLVWWCGVMVKTDCWSHLSKLCTNYSRQVAEQQLHEQLVLLPSPLPAGSDEACTFKQGNYSHHWEGINSTRCSRSSKQEGEAGSCECLTGPSPTYSSRLLGEVGGRTRTISWCKFFLPLTVQCIYWS